MKRGDEAWIMVEDELLSTAQRFTNHLHLAEYQRIRSLAQRNNADVLPDLKRPTDTKTRMSSELRTHKAHEQQDIRTKNGMKKIRPHSGRAAATEDADESDGSESDVPISDRHLAGLMQGAGKGGKETLNGLASSLPSNTRASTGSSLQDSPFRKMKHKPDTTCSRFDAPHAQKKTSSDAAQAKRSSSPQQRSHKRLKASSSTDSPAGSPPPSSPPKPTGKGKDYDSPQIPLDLQRNEQPPPFDPDEPRVERKKPRTLRRTVKHDLVAQPKGGIQLDEIPLFLCS